MRKNKSYKLTKQSHYKLLEIKENDKHTITIIDGRAMGRFICEVSIENNKVVEAEYIYND